MYSPTNSVHALKAFHNKLYNKSKCYFYLALDLNTG